jgi:hypothetical protein
VQLTRVPNDVRPPADVTTASRASVLARVAQTHQLSARAHAQSADLRSPAVLRAVMSAQAEALVASWELLPAEALERVLTHMSGDVLALCAAACVSRAWRDAAAVAVPLSAVRLERLPVAVAQRLTDADLVALVRRARGRLVSLDLCGAQLVTDQGLTAALLQPHALTTFRADITCSQLSATGVVHALEPHRGRVRELSVRGMECVLHLPDTEGKAAKTAWYGECRGIVRTLRALLAPWGTLVGDKVCFGADNQPCARLCRGQADTCKDCGVTLCADHRDDRFTACRYCGENFCRDSCIFDVTGLCQECQADPAAHPREDYESSDS